MTGEHWETTGGDVVEVWHIDGTGWFWHVVAPNRQIVEQGEGYVRRTDCVDAALRHHPRVNLPE